MTARTEKFQRKPGGKNYGIPQEAKERIRFSPEEEAVSLSHHGSCNGKSLHCKQALLEESNTQKASANALFARSEFKDAIETYDKALESCPNYLDYEIAVLRSNVAACHLKLEDWKEAVKAATAALDGLDKLQGETEDGKDGGEESVKIEEEEEADEEIISAGAEKAEKVVVKDDGKEKREADIERIRAKALMRRARARSEQGGWSSLQGAEEGMVICWSADLSAADLF